MQLHKTPGYFLSLFNATKEVRELPILVPVLRPDNPQIQHPERSSGRLEPAREAAAVLLLDYLSVQEPAGDGRVRSVDDVRL